LNENDLFDSKRTDFVFKRKGSSVVITNEDGNELVKSNGSSLFDNNDSLIVKINK